MSDMMVKSKIDGEDSIPISEVESALECDVCLAIPQVNNKKATSFCDERKNTHSFGKHHNLSI
jgi:hypothetical protein